MKSGADHFTLKHEARSELAPKAVWKRLIKPASWWHPDHSYSGDAKNLSLKLKAGGLWREKWSGGDVAHGEILYIKPGEQLRLNAPFGPMQGMAVNAVWTITLTPDGKGTKITFDEVVNGTKDSGLDKLAPAVNFVKSEAIKRLADPSLTQD